MSGLKRRYLQHIGGFATGLTCDLPLRPVLGPDSNTVALSGDADAVMQLRDTSTEVFPPLGDLSIRLPLVLGLPGLGDWVPGPVAQHALRGTSLPCLLEEIMECQAVWFEPLEQRAIAEGPIAIDRSTVLALGAGDGQAVGRAWGRRRGALGYERLDVRFVAHLGWRAGGFCFCEYRAVNVLASNRFIAGHGHGPSY